VAVDYQVWKPALSLYTVAGVGAPLNFYSSIECGKGDANAGEEVVELVYGERCIGLRPREMRRERPGHTLQTTALVNEALPSARREASFARNSEPGTFLRHRESADAPGYWSIFARAGEGAKTREGDPSKWISIRCGLGTEERSVDLPFA